jgi:hypothetical protein
MVSVQLPTAAHSLQNARIVIDHDRDCRLRDHMRIHRQRCPKSFGLPLIWINEI